jgi:tetratricopeptide (TPR) repeat protein
VLTLFPARLQFVKYPRAAEQYLSGTLSDERLLDFSPFYFYLHVAQEALIPEEVVVYLQVAAVGAAAGVLFLILRRAFAPWIAFVGTSAFVLQRSVMVYSAVLEPEIFLIFFLLCFLFFAQRSARRNPLYAGVALAFCVSVRPSVLPLLAVAPLHYFLTDRARWRIATAGVLAPSLALMSVLALRNGAVTGSYSPLGMNPGFVFFEGNNPLSSGNSSVYPPIVGELKNEIPDHSDNPHLTYRLLAALEIGREVSTAEANSFWRRKALAYLVDHPARHLALLGAKGRATLQNYRRHDLVPAEAYDQLLRTSVPSIPFAFVVALAAVGVVASIREWRQRLLVYALLASQLLLMLVFYVSERQRIAALPAIIFFGAHGLLRVAGAAGLVRLRLLAVTLLVALVSMLPSAATREDRHLWSAHEIANRAMQLATGFGSEGKWDEARQAAAAVFAAAPWWKDYSRPGGISFGAEGMGAAALATMRADENPSRRLDRAQLLLAANRWEEAEATLEQLTQERQRFDRSYYQSSQPEYYIALGAIARGELSDAESNLLAALENAPGDPFVLAMLAAITGDASYEQTITRYFGETHTDFLVGLSLLQLGRPGAARRIERTVERLPDYWRARLYLAAAIGAEGDPRRAADFYYDATRSRTEPVMLEERIVPVFATLVERAPTDQELRLRYALVLARFGRFEEGLDVLKATEAAPTPEIERAISEIERMRTGIHRAAGVPALAK